MDNETREVLTAFAEILRAQLVYTLQVHKSTLALQRSVLDEPIANQKYQEQWAKILREVPEPISPEASRSLGKLDELILRLKG